MMALTTKHDKEGYCQLKASDVPFFANCTHSYSLVFTKVFHIVFLALYKQD